MSMAGQCNDRVEITHHQDDSVWIGDEGAIFQDTVVGSGGRYGNGTLMGRLERVFFFRLHCPPMKRCRSGKANVFEYRECVCVYIRMYTLRAYTYIKRYLRKCVFIHTMARWAAFGRNTAAPAYPEKAAGLSTAEKHRG